jgi:hypothetical protein
MVPEFVMIPRRLRRGESFIVTFPFFRAFRAISRRKYGFRKKIPGRVLINVVVCVKHNAVILQLLCKKPRFLSLCPPFFPQRLVQFVGMMAVVVFQYGRIDVRLVVSPTFSHQISLVQFV